MKATVGYITSWRRGIFGSLIASIIFFGLVNTLAQAYIEAVIIKNALGVFALLLGILFVLIVVADPKGIFEGTGELLIEGENISYKDKKRKFSVKKSDVKSVDIKPVYMGQNEKSPLAFNVIVDTGKKKYYIESERARKRQYNEVDLYNIYIELQQQLEKGKE